MWAGVKIAAVLCWSEEMTKQNLTNPSFCSSCRLANKHRKTRPKQYIMKLRNPQVTSHIQRGTKVTGGNKTKTVQQSSLKMPRFHAHNIKSIAAQNEFVPVELFVKSCWTFRWLPEEDPDALQGGWGNGVSSSDKNIVISKTTCTVLMTLTGSTCRKTPWE